MAEAIAEPEAEEAMDEYEEVGNLMNTEAATGLEIDNSLERGLHEDITGKPRHGDPDYQETRRAEILRGKQLMTLS
jgi:hypothetical protein